MKQSKMDLLFIVTQEQLFEGSYLSVYKCDSQICLCIWTEIVEKTRIEFSYLGPTDGCFQTRIVANWEK